MLPSCDINSCPASKLPVRLPAGPRSGELLAAICGNARAKAASHVSVPSVRIGGADVSHLASAGLDARKLVCLVPAKPHLEDALTARETLAFAADVAPGAAALRFALKGITAPGSGRVVAAAPAPVGPSKPSLAVTAVSTVAAGVELPPLSRRRTASAVTADAAVASVEHPSDVTLPTAVTIAQPAAAAPQDRPQAGAPSTYPDSDSEPLSGAVSGHAPLTAHFLKSAQQLVAAHGGSLVNTLLARLGLSAVADTRVRELTPSQVRMLAAGEALLTGPRVLALDRHLDGMTAEEAASAMARWRDHARLAGSVVLIGASAAPPSAAAFAYADQVVAVASSEGPSSPAGIVYAGPVDGVAAFLAAPAPRGWGLTLTLPVASALTAGSTRGGSLTAGPQPQPHPTSGAHCSRLDAASAATIMAAVLEAYEAQALVQAQVQQGESRSSGASGTPSKRGCCAGRRGTSVTEPTGASSTSTAGSGVSVAAAALAASTLCPTASAAAAALARYISAGADSSAAERALRELLTSPLSLTQRWEAAKAAAAAVQLECAAAEPTLPDSDTPAASATTGSHAEAAAASSLPVADNVNVNANAAQLAWLLNPAVKARYGRGSAVPTAAVLLALFLRHMKLLRRKTLLWLPRLALSIGYGLYLGSLYFAPSPKMYTAKASLASYLCVILSAAVAFETRAFVRMAKVWHGMMDIHGWTSAKSLVGVTCVAVGVPVSFVSSFLISLPIYTMVDYAADTKARFLFFW